MAYAYRDGKSLWIGYKDAHGRPHRERTALPTVTAARRFAEELEQSAERVRKGLEASPPPPTSFSALAQRYLSEVASQKRSEKHIESRVRLHLRPELDQKLLTEIHAGDVEGLLARKGAAGLAPQTVEHLRLTLHAMFAFALRAGLFRGANPIDDVPKREIPERDIRYLEPAVVAKVVAFVPEHWRDLFATAALVGARKGELLGLRVADVDLEHRVLTLSRSYGGPTKGGRRRVVPIPEELLPFLASAVQRARGGLLFATSRGKMMSKHTDLPVILRRALVAAKVIDHWELVCRRKGCGHRERSEQKRTFPCPKCKFSLWPVAVPPAYQFKDLRSTWGTFAAEATSDLRFVQHGLGHVDPKTTEKHYAAVRARHAGAQADKIRFGLTPPPVSAAGRPEKSASPTQPALSREADPPKSVRPPGENHQGARELTSVGATGVEPAAFGFGGSGGVLPVLAVCGCESAALARVDNAVGAVRQDSPVLTQPALSRGPLLTVDRVSELLGVCAATVYRICARGELEHSRVGNNTVRIARADLEAYLARRRTAPSAKEPHA